MASAIGSAVLSFECSSSYAHHRNLSSSRLLSLSVASSSKSTIAWRLLSFSRCNSNKNSIARASRLVSISTNAEEVDVVKLSALLAATQQNCDLFPTLLNDGTVVPVDPAKLRRALRHSTVVVSLFVAGLEVENSMEGGEGLPRQQLDEQPARRWLDLWMPRPTGKKTLVAFGRATSDHTLTASIYDLVVAPSYQRSGYGSRVLLRIVRELRLRGISDIAVTPSPELRAFFQHCGFAPDALKSVTMMYTRSPSSTTQSLQVKEYGRKSLLIPAPLRVSQGERSPHLCKAAARAVQDRIDVQII